MGQLRDTIKQRLIDFGSFVYRKETREIFGRTCSGWGQIGLFFSLFYSVLAIIFTIHLAIFLGVTPLPRAGTPPWNYGRYAYMNYPNRKIDLILTPRRFTFNRGSGTAELSEYDYNYMNRLRSGATASGVGSHCLNRESRFGFSIGQPCVYLHIVKAFDWTAGLINPSLYDDATLPFNCTLGSTETMLAISPFLTSQPSALPLNISNNANSRSFPFINQNNYRPPVIGLILNFTALPDNLPNRFDAEVTCIVDFDELGMVRPSDSELNRLYEIPTEATTSIRVQS